MSIVLFAGLASMGAGAVHAAAAGIHAEHRSWPRSSSSPPCSSSVSGCGPCSGPTRLAAWAVVFVNVGAVVGWLYTRLGGISWIEGLEVREAPQFADTACAALAVVAVVTGYTGAILPAERRQHRGLLAPAALIGMFAVWTMFAAGTHVHSHGEAGHTHDATAETADGHVHTADEAADGAAPRWHRLTGTCTPPTRRPPKLPMGTSTPPTRRRPSQPTATSTRPTPPREPVALAWPRPWDPAGRSTCPVSTV